MVVDYMHAVLLGVIRSHTELLLTSVGESFYIGAPKMLRKLDQILLAIRLPSCVKRTPRSINDRQIWKASEWRNWLVLYAPICLQNILPRKYFKHIGLLSSTIHMLLSNSISPTVLRQRQNKITSYVTYYQQYFGTENMTYNIHLLQHVVTGVMDWGPIWTHSNFPFENANRLVLNMKQSPYALIKQLSNRHIIMQNLAIIQVIYYTLKKISNFCSLHINCS